MTDVRIARARSQLVLDHPFFGCLALRLRVVVRNDVQTMATDGKHLFCGPRFLDESSEELLRTAVAHEVLHCALSHHTRRGSRDPQRWNMACDYVVNLMLVDAGFFMPDWAYMDRQYADLNAEEVYRLLEQQAQQQQQDQEPPEPDVNYDCDSIPDQRMDASDFEEEIPRSGSNGHSDDLLNDGVYTGDRRLEDSLPLTRSDPGGLGEVLDAASEHDQAALDEAEAEWQVYTRQAVNVARRAGEGRLPGFIEEIVEQINAPRTDWRAVLRRFVDPSNTKDYSRASPNRRYMSLGFYTPGLVSDGVNHVALLIDTSDSIDSEWLRQFGAEAQAALDDGAVDKVTVVFADEKVQRTAEYNRGDAIDLTCVGRGGTRFAPTFQWLNENAADLSAAIYFTDLECTDFGPTPSYPVLWAAYGDDPRTTKAHMERVPFGECVELK